MVLRVSGNLSKIQNALSLEAILKERLAVFLSEGELEATEISFVAGETVFSAQDSILQKIKQNMPVRRI